MNIEILNHGSGITAWELDRLIRLRTLQNMISTIATLESLVRLLSSQTTIVIKDHIQTIFKDSLFNLGLAKDAILDQEYNQASVYARQAILAAESAFFDPTMVPLLYFPDEHKLAIFMPFFVPIAIPLLRALYYEFKLLRLKTKTD